MAAHRLGMRLDQAQARRLRGAVATRSARPEFHQHDGDRLVYRHPLIRYDVSTGEAVIAGLAEGAVLLRSLPPIDELTLGGITHRVLGRRFDIGRVEIGPTSEPVAYAFRTPYLALNQENYRSWERARGGEGHQLLERVVVGNLLSLAKAIGLHVGARLRAEVALVPDDWQELKPGVRLLGFRGGFRVNFALPEPWGIGKSSSRGFGTLTRQEA